ncbi:MAG: class I SAM-dependent methyltransferase [Candidatus Aenigmarchaeota archaeon]|nr:class I SAM-dependent methyltransferase [Candidatus Aenigmarchaeota archaeon]
MLYNKSSKIISNDKKTKPYWQRFFSDFEGRILDVGCGNGNFVSLDKENIIGIDNDPDALKACSDRGLNCLLMDVQKTLDFPDNTFDCVHASQILEHLNNPVPLVKEFYRILKPNGILIAAVPDAKKIGHQFWDDYTHKRPYSRKSLREIVFDNGFRGIEITPEPKSIRGAGYLCRREMISPKFVNKLQDFLSFIGIRGNSLYVKCRKHV